MLNAKISATTAPWRQEGPEVVQRRLSSASSSSASEPFAPRMKNSVPEIQKKSLKCVEIQEWPQDTTMARPRPHGPDHHLRRKRKGGMLDRPSTDRRDSIKQGTGQTKAPANHLFLNIMNKSSTRATNGSSTNVVERGCWRDRSPESAPPVPKKESSPPSQLPHDR